MSARRTNPTLRYEDRAFKCVADKVSALKHQVRHKPLGEGVSLISARAVRFRL